VFISLKNSDKEGIIEAAKTLIAEGFTLVATQGTASFLKARGLEVTRINKVAESQPHIVDAMINGEICLVFNTTEGAQSLKDSA